MSLCAETCCLIAFCRTLPHNNKSATSPGQQLEPDILPDTKRRREDPLLADTAPPGSITFNGCDVSFSQNIRRPPGGRELRVYTSTAAVCVSALLQCEGMQIQQCHSAHRQDVITVVVPLCTVLKLPVLKDLWQVTVPQIASQDISNAKDAADSSLVVSQACTAPFTPPTTIWALVSLLLVLKDSIDLWSLFGNVDTDPRLAAHTILMSDFCGDEEAGGKVRTWLYSHAMLRVAHLCTASADLSHSAPVVWHLSEVFLALPEEQLPFIDESKRKRASTPDTSAATSSSDAADGAEDGEARVSVRFALQLPPPLLNAWLRRQRRVTVDFRELQYENGPTALVALTGATHLQELTLRGGLTQHRGKAEAQVPCIGCGNTTSTFKCTSCTRPSDSSTPQSTTTPGAIKNSTRHSARLSVACMHSMCAPLSAVLCCLVSLSGLRKLHMHGMHVVPGDLAFFGVVARALSGTLVHLTICNFEGGMWCVPAPEKSHRYGSMHKEMFFKTIAMFSGLRTLQMTTLQQFVAGQDMMMLSPLKTMSKLKTLIFLHQSTDEAGLEVLTKHLLETVNPELRLLDSPCTVCA